MKPPKFHVGQAVVCVHNQPWKPVPEYNNGSQPLAKGNRIYTVAENYPHGGAWYLILQGEPNQGYNENGFAPVELLPDEALAQLLEETLEPVNA